MLYVHAMHIVLGFFYLNNYYKSFPFLLLVLVVFVFCSTLKTILADD